MKDKLTDFERRVLKEILKIPMGKTRSYSWLAKRLGKPKAIRAVGRALRNNPLPFIIPCHRIIRKDGSVGGYLFGERFKKKLLDLERTILKLIEGGDDEENKGSLKRDDKKRCL
jgi:methylated-DNA-[protein]-cysteine S-methyltransferase